MMALTDTIMQLHYIIIFLKLFFIDKTITQVPFVNIKIRKRKVRKTSPYLNKGGGSVRWLTRCLFHLTVTLKFTTVHSGISPTALIRHRLGMGDSARAEIKPFKKQIKKKKWNRHCWLIRWVAFTLCGNAATCLWPRKMQVLTDWCWCFICPVWTEKGMPCDGYYGPMSSQSKHLSTTSFWKSLRCVDVLWYNIKTWVNQIPPAVLLQQLACC